MDKDSYCDWEWKTVNTLYFLVSNLWGQPVSSNFCGSIWFLLSAEVRVALGHFSNAHWQLNVCWMCHFNGRLWIFSFQAKGWKWMWDVSVHLFKYEKHVKPSIQRPNFLRSSFRHIIFSAQCSLCSILLRLYVEKSPQKKSTKRF